MPTNEIAKAATIPRNNVESPVPGDFVFLGLLTFVFGASVAASVGFSTLASFGASVVA